MINNETIEWELFFDRFKWKSKTVDRRLFSRNKARKIAYGNETVKINILAIYFIVIFGLCLLSAFFGSLSVGLGFDDWSWGLGVAGTFFGWFASIFLYLGAKADYPDVNLQIYFTMVSYDF